MNTKSFEERRWSSYNQNIQFRHRAALSLLAESNSVLDVGTGSGLLIELLTHRNSKGRFEGVDISEEAVKKCSEENLSVQLILTAEKLPYDSEEFEYVVLLDILEHTYEPLPILIEASRVASKGVIVGVPNFSSLPARLQVIFGKVPENNRPNKGHVYWFNYYILKRLIANAALKTDGMEMNTNSVFSFFKETLLSLMPNLFALSFVAKVKK